MKLGRLIVDVKGLELSKEEAEILNHPYIGGVIIFSKNFGAEPWIALKFPAEQWYFFMIEDLKKDDLKYF